MAKVIVTMHYEVEESQRDAYLSAVEELKAHYATNPYVSYFVCEQKGKKNAFAEIYLAHSEVAYRKFEESEDDVADQIAAKLSPFISGKQKYTTYVEAV
jgi:hypothetical protein